MKTEGVGVFYFYLKSCFSKFVLLKINFFLFYLTLAYSYCTTVRLGQNLVFKAKCILGETAQCVKKVKILSCSKKELFFEKSKNSNISPKLHLYKKDF